MGQDVDAAAPLQAAPETQKPGQKVIRPSTLRNSVISDGTAQTRSTAERYRKKSTLRGALSRLFGRRKKSSLQGTFTGSDGRSTVAGSSQQHGGGRPSMQSSGRRLTKTRVSGAGIYPSNIEEVRRITSMPLTEHDQALRSHPIGANEGLASSRVRNSFSVSFGHVRRPTDLTSTPSMGIRGFSGLSPRPSSAHGRAPRLVRDASDPEQIGRALTGDFSGLNRRSQSLSFLLGQEDDGSQARRRSDEIRYWRESYDHNHMSRVSSTSHGGDETEVGATYVLGSTSNDPPRTPIRPFQFGDLATMNEMAGMKITEVASMDSRIHRLERRLGRLERAMKHPYDSVPNLHSQPDASDPVPQVLQASDAYPASPSTGHGFQSQAGGQDSRGWSRPSTRHSEVSKKSFGDGQAFGVVRRPAASQKAAASDRPVSMATVRGVASLPSMPKDHAGTLTPDHYTTLMALIETERSSRLALEAQIRQLSHQLNIMSRASHVPAAEHGTHAPGPSLGETSAFDHDDDDDEEHEERERGRSTVRRRLVAEGEASEPALTPREERHDTSVFREEFGDEPVVKRPSARRALSLSHITFRKPGSKQRQQ